LIDEAKAARQIVEETVAVFFEIAARPGALSAANYF